MTLQAALSRFQDSLPHRPYCSDDLESGLMIRGRSQALKRAYIQHNPPALSRWLAFDIDRPEATLAWHDANLPPPTLAIQTPANGHGHLLYALAAPVYTDPAARPRPIRYLAAIERTYTIALGADPGYAGLVTKNPLHGRWRAFSFRAAPYDLAELQEYVTDLAPANDHVYDAKKMGAAGRHCYLFDTLRAWAYRHVKTFRAQGGYEVWLNALIDQAISYNIYTGMGFKQTDPLPYSHIKMTAKSVAKWTWSRYQGDGSEFNRGAMGFGETRHDYNFHQPYLPTEEALRRRRASAERTNRLRRDQTEARIRQAIAELRAAGERVTKTAVARLTDLSDRSLRKDYAHLFRD